MNPGPDAGGRGADAGSGLRHEDLQGGPPATDSRTIIQDYLEAAARRKWLALGVFLGVLAMITLSIVKTTPVFQARTTILVTDNNQGSLFGKEGTVFWPSGPNTANIVELLQSRSLAESVAKRLPDSALPSGSAVAARPVRNAEIIEVIASAPTRAAAVSVANAYADAYEQYDLGLSRLDVSAIRQFVENQLAVVGSRLDSSEQDLAQFKTAHKLTSIDEATRAMIERQSDLAAEYQRTLTEAKGNQAQLSFVQGRIAEEGKSMADVDAISSPLVAELKGTLNQIEVDKTNLLIRGFAPNSERIKVLDRQIDSTRARLRTESQKLITRQGFVDPAGHLNDLLESALTLNTGLASSQARQAALANALAGFDTQLERLPEAERQLARLTRDVETGRRVHSLLSERYEEARIREVGRISSVRIIDRASQARQTRPNVRSSLVAGLLLALVLAVGAVVAAENLDTAIHGQDEVERRGYAVLGSIPRLSLAGRRTKQNEAVTSHLITHTDFESSGAEAFRMLRTALAFTSAERPMRTIAVTSPGPSEGKTTVAVNLASVLAQAGSRVLLIDGDLRHPALHTLFKRGKKPGLSDLVVLNVSPAEAVFPTGLDGLSCLPCGTIPPSPADLLTLNATRALLERLETEYDYVVIDTAPVLVAADTPIIGTLADTTIMVVRADRTTLDALNRAGSAMLSGGAHLSGLVVNDVKRTGRYGRYYYYYYKYHYYRHGQQKANGVRTREGTEDEGAAPEGQG